jgi:hypothetical protein
VNGAPSYASGPDETTLTLNNPDALDLDMDVSSSNYNSTLRIIPFDYKYEAKTLAASAYEEMSIDDIQTLPDIRIPGENFFKELAGLTGTALMLTANASKNGQYAVVRYWERRSDLANHPYHWFYSTDRGASWTKFSTTKHSGNKAAFIDQYGSAASQNNDQMMFVANNGKMFSCYLFQQGSGYDQINAVYSDLSAGTPVLSDSVDVGQGAGVIATAGSAHYYGHVAGDVEDASMVVCAYFDFTNNSMGMRVFGNGGASVLSSSVSGSITQGQLLAGIHVSGSGTSHRVHLTRRDTQTDGNIAYYYFDQPTYTWSSATSIETGNHVLFGSSFLNNRLILFYRNNPYTNLKFATLTSAFGGSPSAVVKGTLSVNSSLLIPDEFHGWSDTSNFGRNAQRLGNKTIIQNPNDEKHCFFVLDMNQSSEAVRRPYIWEVQDVSNFKGVQISQYGSGSHAALNNLTSRQRIGQTFTASAVGQRVRAMGAMLFRSGTGAVSGQIQCHIYATSGGIPTTILASSLNTLDVSRINVSGNAAWYYFKFNNLDLTNGTQYAMVLSTTQAVDATNYVRWNNANGNPYAGGAPVQFDGTTWTLSGVTDDYAFEVYGDYVHDIGMENGSLFGQGTVNQFNYTSEAQQSQIHLIDSSNFVVSTRRFVVGSDAFRPFQGHIYRTIGTIGTPSASPSGLTSLVVAGYATGNHDRNLIFSTALGTDTCAQLSVAGTPGVIDTAKKGEDRSGMCVLNNAYFNVVAGDYQADSSFQSGFCQVFNGSNRDISYVHSDIHNLQSTRPFAIEVEVKFSSLASEARFISKSNSGLGYGWDLRATTAGAIVLIIQNSGGTVIGRADTINGVVTTNTYYVIRVTYAGDGTAPKIFISTTGPNGTFVEQSYATQTAFSGNTASSSQLIIGSQQGGSWLNGKIGYVKIMKGLFGSTSPAFAYTGWKSQPAMQIVNLGNRFTAVQLIGKNSNTTGTGNEQFFKPGIIDGQYANQAAMVDSNDLVFYYNKTLENTAGSTMYLKATLGRASTRDASAIQGINFRYAK